ncbi:MAG: hypothetical protein WC876_03640 [Candidatus Thermoplasmatota archaeon]|jgi:hypothetical protein
MRWPWLVVLLAGCASPAADGPNQPDPLAPAEFKPISYSFADEFLAGGVDAPKSFPFEVPNGTGEVAALLTWTIPGAILEFQILDPSQTVVADGWAESAQRRYVATTDQPVPGNWSIVVSAERGVDIHFAVNVTARAAEPFGPIAQTYTVQRGSFAEVNLNMVPGESFNYTWSADGDLYFNIHYHADGTTTRPVEFTGRSHDGNFVAPDRQVYSLLLRNDGLLPVEVSISVDGSYRLHSMTR